MARTTTSFLPPATTAENVAGIMVDRPAEEVATHCKRKCVVKMPAEAYAFEDGSMIVMVGGRWWPVYD